jgi:Cd2+/Zn2+-exporting ATPase
VVHVVIDEKYAGYIIISDEIKEDARTAIQKLRDVGIKRQVMFTGDNQEVAKTVAQKLGLDEYFAELLPQQKVEKIEELIKKKADKNDLISFVGDGINDAPVLIRSDIGIAMGALGSDAAIEAADVVLMSDEPSKLYEAVKIANRTKNIVWQNIGFALEVKGIFLTMATLGMATMWEAVFADVGVRIVSNIKFYKNFKIINETYYVHLIVLLLNLLVKVNVKQYNLSQEAIREVEKTVLIHEYTDIVNPNPF